MSRNKPAARRPGRFAAAALILALQAAAVLAGPTAKFDIPAQPLSSALRALASQAGVQLVFMPETVGAAKGVAVQGEMSVEAALRQLLAGSGLEFRQEGERNYVVVHSPSSARESTLPEMVVTATKTAAPLRDVPFAMSVVGAEAIGQQSPRDISDILRREAGVDINRSTPLGVATVSIRGGDSAAQRTQVLIDGQPSDFISTGVGGLTALQIVDPQNVERVEIVRGAGSALYGPSAVGGVVNIITRRGDPARPQTRVFAGVEERGSSHAGFASSGGNAATGFTYQINGRHARYGGYKPEPTPTPNDSQSLQNIRDRTDAIGGRLGFWFTDRNELAVTLNAQEARGDSFGRPETRYAIGNRVLGLESNNWLSDAYRLSVAVSQRSHRGDYDFDSFFASDTPPSTARTSTLNESADKLSIDIKNQWDVATGHRLLFGLQYVKDDASLRYFTPTTGAQQDDRGGSVKNLGLYVQDEMRFGERWFLTAGLRHDRFDYDLHYSNFTTVPTTARTVSKSWQTTNPRLGARYRLTAATDLRASVGKAFRAPDTFGLMGRQLIPGVLDFRPNLNLDAEKATTVDLGFDHDFGGGLKTSVTVYQTEIKDAMVVTRTGAGPMVLQWNNLGKLVNEGVELEVRKRFGDAWQTYANYTHSVSRAASEPPAGAVGWPCNGCKLALNPVHKLAFGVTYRPSDVLVVRGDGRYVSESYATGDTANTQANRLPGYFVADIKATWYRKFGKDRGELSAGLRNLAGQKYATRSVGTYEEPRTAFVQLGYSVF